LKTLLQLQDLDLKIEAYKQRETEIPKQKEKFEIRKKRLAEELSQSEQRFKTLSIEQRECEVDIQQKEAQIKKYDIQLLSVKKNDEYQALLHEMDGLKKQIALKEERILTLMLEIDESKAHLEEDKKRIASELKDIVAQCAKIDDELATAVSERQNLEAQRAPLIKDIDKDLMARYVRVRGSKKTGAAVVPLRGESCSGCHMKVTAQTINEIMAGHKVHSCRHCGRLLYHPEFFNNAPMV
jgi:uncharacterized protein